MIIEIPAIIESVLNTLMQNGYEAYAVGGCIRDSLLGKCPEDWDICTQALPEETASCFKNNRVINTGIKHGTVTVVLKNVPVEITTFRKDGKYSDNRHPDKVEFVDSLKEDLSRRDFTINAMAYNPQTGLIDYFGGRTDLKKRLIKCVGIARQRFQEDALRILRALRFASVFDFDVYKDTSQAIFLEKHLLESISAERISVEFNKLICGVGAEGILRQYIDIMEVIIPELIQFEKQNNWEHALKRISNAPADLQLRLAALFNGISGADSEADSDTAVRILKRLRNDNDTIKVVETLIRYYESTIEPSRVHIKKWLNIIGETVFRKLLELRRAGNQTDIIKIEKTLNEIIRQGQCFSFRQLSINGDDLLHLGVKEGKLIGKVLSSLLDMVINEELENDKGKLLIKAKDIIARY